jgi:hypothetical protein
VLGSTGGTPSPAGEGPTPSTDAGAAPQPSPPGQPGQPAPGASLERGLWIWDHSVAADTSARTTLFDFAVQHDVTTLYLEAQTLLSTAGDRATLADFVTAARSRGLDTDLLFGDATWALTANHDTAVALAQAAVTFTKTAPTKPVGVHFDVEPNTLDAWNSDMNGTANQYLDLLDELHAALAGSGLRLSVDFNFSFGHRSIVGAGTRAGTQMLSRWVAHAVDRLYVMAYRDQAAGSNGFMDIASESVADADAVGKPIVIGVNTSCGRPAGTSFCPDGATALAHQLDVATTSYASGQASQAVAGFAVHDYTGYAALKP